MGLGIVALISTGIAGCEHKAKLAAQKEVVRLESTIETMIATQKVVNDERDRVVESWKQANVLLKADAAKQRTLLVAESQRVRGRPSDSSGREIAITTRSGDQPTAVPEKLVPLTEYESLQDRAREDALQVTLLQDYVQGQCRVSAD
jgi:hypothetical protein